MRHHPVSLCLLLGLAACATAGPLTQDEVISRYYERHASEENGYCPRPYIDGITRREVVEETAERIVLDVGYLYRDRSKSGTSRGVMRECVGFATRRFVLEKSGDTFEVTEMGESRLG